MVVIQKIGGYTRVIGPSMENSRFNVSDAFDGTGTYNVAIRLDNNIIMVGVLLMYGLRVAHWILVTWHLLGLVH